MSAMVVALALLAGSGCDGSGSGSSGPIQGTPAIGFYVLTQIAGDPLPVATIVSAEETFELLAGSMHLQPGGTAIFRTTGRRIDPIATTSINETREGIFRQPDFSVELRFGSDRYVAELTSGRLRVPIDGEIWVFQRSAL